MSDPIDKLTRLGDALEGAPMPLPASEIRARGDRIRRRKHALVAGASAAVVAAVAVPVVALTLNGSDDPGNLAPHPSVSDPVAPAALSAENLITADDAAWNEVGTEFEVSETYPGDGLATPSPCFQSSFAGLGAETVFQRDFRWTKQTSGTDTGPQLNEVIGEFASPEDALTAYNEIQGWYDDCLPAGAESFDAGEFAPVDIPVDGEGVQMVATYGPVDEKLDPFGYDGWFLDTGLVVAGDRVAVVTALSHGQDYNLTPTPAARMVPAAAERLVRGNGVGDEPAEGDWPTTIPDDFPLDSGWPENDGSDEFQLDAPSEDNQAMLAAGELSGCQDIPAGEPVDRLTTRLTWAVNSYAREIQLFADDTAAMAYLDSIQDSYATCEAEGPSGSAPSTTTEVLSGTLGDEHWAITQASDGIGRGVYHVFRVGNAVAVDLASDEGNGAAVDELGSESGGRLAEVIRSMYDLQGDAADPMAPAGTTTVPSDFPIDLNLGTPEFDDPDQTADGPAPDAAGARALTMCGVELTFPNTDNADPEHELSTSVSTIEGYDGRTIHAYPTAQEAVDGMADLRAQIQGCDRDDGGDGISDRLYRSYNSNTGYESETFGWHYEATDSQPAGAGQIYTVLRVGNAIVTVEWSSEWGVEAMEDAVPRQVEVAGLIGDEMQCLFSVAGC